MDIQYDRYSFTIEGRRQFIRSGAMHYFRLPHQRLWQDRLQKLKYAGYNTVDLYFNWDYHSKAPGVYDFTGIRDVDHLLDMVEAQGLYLIARPGPYINAETARGGLPAWLLSDPEVILRNRKEGAFTYSERYMSYVRQWLDQILPKFKDRPNLLMVQVENEYSTIDMEPDYMQELIDIYRSYGIQVPTMHNDFYAAGLYADLVDIYAIDNYSVTAFDMNWRTFPDLFSVLDHLETNIRDEFCPDRPLMIAELQAGWFAGWKSVCYDTIHQSLGREHIGLVTRSFIGQGGTAFNHYKAVGGTNWDHIGATDAYTSYDFAAPISEAGVPTERLFEAKRINLFLTHFDMTQTERVESSEIGIQHNEGTYVVRKDLTKAGTYWIITRNITSSPKRVEIKPGISTEVQPYRSMILPYELKLKSGWQLHALTAEPLVQTEQMLILPSEHPVVVDLTAPSQISMMNSGTGIQAQARNEKLTVSVPHPMPADELTYIHLGSLHIYFLGSHLADRIWPLSDGRYVIGPDLVMGDNEFYLSQNRPCWITTLDGNIQPLNRFERLPSYLLPMLEDWTLQPGGKPLVDSQGFKPLAPKGCTMDSHELFEGAAWYRYPFEGPAERLTIYAQHIWAVFLNGHGLIQNHTFHVHPEVGSPGDAVSIQLPQDHLNEEGLNELVIFTESLGHHKGFYEDTHDPRGVLGLVLDGKNIHLDGSIQVAPLTASEDTIPTEKAPNEAPIVYASTTFQLNINDDFKLPLGLEIDFSNIERVNIRLNGVLIGKYWEACGNQKMFYLPEGVLNTNGPNHLELALINFIPLLSLEKPFPKGYGRVSLVPYQAFFKLS